MTYGPNLAGRRAFTKLLHRSMALRVLRRHLGAIDRLKADGVVALTFDDGPDATATPKVLDILDKYNARATFFVVGLTSERNPAVLRQIRDRGHAIGNHSYSHPSFPSLSWSRKLYEINACDAFIDAKGPKLFRAPFGHLDGSTFLACYVLGYLPVTWSVHAQDWSDVSGSRMLSQLIERVQSGSIVLLHDRLHVAKDFAAFDRQRMLSALDAFLKMLGGKFVFKTLPEMLSTSTAVRVRGYDPLTNDELARNRQDLAGLISNPC